MKDIPYYYKFASDGIYLYLTNVDAVVEGSENEDVIIYEVYNKEREKIDVFQPTTNDKSDEVRRSLSSQNTNWDIYSDGDMVGGKSSVI